MTRKKIVAVTMLTVLLLACSKVPITNRKQFKMLPESMMIDLSITSYRDFLQKNPPVPGGDSNAELVKRVGSRMSQAVSAFLRKKGYAKRLQGYRWEYNLVNDPTVNAWCMPGGKIVIYSGILPYSMDETGLAVIMGHEIAHAIARHGNERMSQQLALAGINVGLAVALSQKPKETQDIFLQSVGVASTLGVLAYSRKHELEADKMGLVFMAIAGYDPSQAIPFWERMSKIGGPNVPLFLSTHPGDAQRIKEIRKYLPMAMKYYNKPEVAAGSQ